MRRRKIIVLSILLTALSAASLMFVQSNCPRTGTALTTGARAFVRLKNRTELPRGEDFDARVTLAALLQPGDDHARWSESHAGAVEGYVVEVRPGGIESANCHSVTRRDTHIYVAQNPSAPPRERLVVEVTPRMREWAGAQGRDWSETALRRELVGRRCRFEGWMLYDTEHAHESENASPGRAPNWRATAWEIHPVTRIEVLE